MKTPLVLVTALMLATASGCHSTWSQCQRAGTHIRHTWSAERAWHCRKWMYDGILDRANFKEGFKAGYRFAQGGCDSCDPRPKQSWCYHGKTHCDQNMMAAWSEGFTHGSLAAQLDGVSTKSDLDAETAMPPAGVPDVAYYPQADGSGTSANGSISSQLPDGTIIGPAPNAMPTPPLLPPAETQPPTAPSALPPNPAPGSSPQAPVDNNSAQTTTSDRSGRKMASASAVSRPIKSAKDKRVAAEPDFIWTGGATLMTSESGQNPPVVAAPRKSPGIGSLRAVSRPAPVSPVYAPSLPMPPSTIPPAALPPMSAAYGLPSAGVSQPMVLPPPTSTPNAPRVPAAVLPPQVASPDWAMPVIRD